MAESAFKVSQKFCFARLMLVMSWLVAAELLFSSAARVAAEETLSQPAAAGAESPTRAEDASARNASPEVELDHLLQLPDSLDYSVERHGKATEGEWRTRLENARAELAQAQDALTRAQEKLEELAAGTENWQFAPPGMSAEGSGDVTTYELRQEVKRQRAEVERSERKLRELKIEARLAGVPENWLE